MWHLSVVDASLPANAGFFLLCSLLSYYMKVLSSLYSLNSKTGAPVVWEFCETASGKFCATNGFSLKPARNVADLRRMFSQFESYTRKDGTRTFSRTPLTATVKAAMAGTAMA